MNWIRKDSADKDIRPTNFVRQVSIPAKDEMYICYHKGASIACALQRIAGMQRTGAASKGRMLRCLVKTLSIKTGDCHVAGMRHLKSRCLRTHAGILRMLGAVPKVGQSPSRFKEKAIK